MIKRLSIFLFFLLCSTTFLSAEELPLLSVLQFKGSGISDQEIDIIVDFVSSHVASSGKYRILTREQREAILNETSLKSSDCFEEKCQIEIAKLLKVDNIITGSISKIGSQYILFMNLIDIATEETIITGSRQYQDVDELINNSQEFTIAFLNDQLNAQVDQSEHKSDGTIKENGVGVDKSMEGFAVSVNPLGFVQFGPSISLEYGITENIVLDVNFRFPSLGILSYVINYDNDTSLDDMTGFSGGLGVYYFITENADKPYVGLLFNFQQQIITYDLNQYWEWKRELNSYVLVFSGGYRFRFGGGFFINTGLFFGAAFTDWSWYYTENAGTSDKDDININNPKTGTSTTPFGMLELSFGFEF